MFVKVKGILLTGLAFEVFLWADGFIRKGERENGVSFIVGMGNHLTHKELSALMKEKMGRLRG